MANDIPVQVVITAKDNASAVVKKFGATSKQAGQEATAGFSSITKAAGILGIAMGVAGLVAAVKSSVRQFAEQQAVMAQTEAVLKSTGGAAGMTANEVRRLSESLAQNSAIDDDVIQGAENLLLTFTSIGKNIFPQATQSVIDISRALGQDLKGSAIQVGKALQDPILGVTALRRVGVNFNETAQKTIKNLVESNHLLEAQKFILKELQNEFAGSEAAYARTLGGQLDRMKVQLGNLAEVVGQTLSPAIFVLTNALGSGLSGAIEWVKRNMYYLQLAFVTTASAAKILFTILGAGFSFVGAGFEAIRTGSMNPFREANEDMWTKITTITKDASTAMDNAVKDQFSSNITAAKGAKNEIVDTAKTQRQKIAEELAKEEKDFKTSVDKREKTFKRQLGDLIRSHQETRDDLKSDLDDENSDYKDSLEEQADDHKEKVDEIKAQIDEETAKGVEADQKAIESLQLRLVKEEEENKKQTEKLKKEHEKRLADIQKRLTAEEDLLKKHQGDVDAIKDQAVLDDIDRLKQQYEEEKAESEKQHQEKLADIKAKGAELGGAYGGAINNAVLSAGGDVKKNLEKIANESGEGFKKNITVKSSEAGKSFLDGFFPLVGITGMNMKFETVLGNIRGFINTAKGLLGSIGINLPSSSIGLNTMFSGVGISGISGGSSSWAETYRTKYAGWGETEARADWKAKGGTFQTGGIVSGLGAVPAIVHGGEMVLNNNQQSKLFGLLNGGGLGASIPNISLSVSVGIYAGSAIEKRQLAVELWEELGKLARSLNKTPQELIGYAGR